MTFNKNLDRYELIKKYSTNIKSFITQVKGTSMFPILKDGEFVKVKISNNLEFKIGDILVFAYKDEGVLIHRLLKIRNEKYYCKGDNSFRLEDVTKTNIIGVAELECDEHHNKKFVKDSLKIANLYRKSQYNSAFLKKKRKYHIYKKKYLAI